MVARSAVETSTGKNRFLALSWRLSRSNTSPGWTRARRFSASIATTAFMYLLQSSTKARPTVWPHCEVPPPRGSSATPSSRAMASAAATSSRSRGTATPSGSIW